MQAAGHSAARFLHLDGWNGWRIVAPSAVTVTPDGLELPSGELPSGEVAPDVMAQVRARGLAFDHLGRMFAVRDDGRGFCRFADAAYITEPCLSGLEPGERVGGLAIDRRGRLFVALPKLRAVRAYRLSPSGELANIPMSRPVAVAVDGRDRIYVLDRDGSSPSGGAPVGFDVVRLVRQAGDAIAVSEAGAIAIVTRLRSTLELAIDGENFVAIELGRATLPAVAFAPSTDGALRLYVADAPSGRIIEWEVSDGKARAVRWSAQVDAWRALAYRGQKLYGLGRACTAKALDFEQNGFYARSAAIVLGPLDASAKGTEWHRVIAQVSPDLSAAASVAVEVLASDDVSAYDATLGADDPRWESARELVSVRAGHPAELAFGAARGRYAWLRLTLHGDGRHTPRIRWLRIEFPRNSYLRLLPAIYSEDPTSRAFSARLLSLFEAENADLSQVIDDLYRLFAPMSGDPDFLPWLAARLDVLLEPDWTVERRRAVLARAIPLYRRRGTRQAFLEMLENYDISGVELIEGSRERALFRLGGAHLGCDAVLPGACSTPRMQLDRGIRLGTAQLGSRPYLEADPIVERRAELTLLLRPSTALDDAAFARIQRLAELEAPAGARVTVARGRARFGLGAGGRLGLDAALGGRAPWRLAGEGDVATSAGAMLLAREVGMGGDLALGVGPRLGMDASL
ncbi:MAG TPA: phage tail protein [Polyangiaceae bacterium]|nr:phage tail protein [Polyangiaceae bacterium]